MSICIYSACLAVTSCRARSFPVTPLDAKSKAKTYYY